MTAAPRLTRPDGSPVRALVVDDEVPLGELLQMALRYEGWQVETAAAGQPALHVARQFRPDVIVLDIMLPDLDGLEVLRRLRGLLRRSGRAVSDAVDPEIRVGDLVLNEESYEVTRAGRPIELTATEFELLRYLMRNPRRVLSKMQILDRVWSYDFEGRSSIVEIYISYLRKKIDAGQTPMIHTVRGVGYLIKPTS